MNVVGSVAVDLEANRRSGAGSKGWVAAEHGNARAILRTAKRYHVLAHMGGDKLAVMGAAVGQNVLDKVVSELITGNCITSVKDTEDDCSRELTVNQGHAWTILTTFADPLKVAIKELVATDLKTLLDDFGSILVHAVLGRKAKNMINSSATVCRRSVLADVLDTPVAELAVGDDIDASKNLVDAGTLYSQL